jgi:hypothetical protein
MPKYATFETTMGSFRAEIYTEQMVGNLSKNVRKYSEL